MCGRKKCSPIVEHPVLCGMVVGFAAIGVCGVVMAMKQQGAKWKKTAAEVGTACMDNVKKTAANAVESGMQAVDGLLRKMPGQSGGDQQTQQDQPEQTDGQDEPTGKQTGSGRKSRKSKTNGQESYGDPDRDFS